MQRPLRSPTGRASAAGLTVEREYSDERLPAEDMGLDLRICAAESCCEREWMRSAP